MAGLTLDAERFSRTTSDGRAYTVTRNDLVFASDSELRALAEVHAADDADLKFAADSAAAIAKVLDGDRYDLRQANRVSFAVLMRIFMTYLIFRCRVESLWG